MSYSAFAALKKHVEEETIRSMAPEEINEVFNSQHETIQKVKKALEDCHEAFRQRKHGGVAEQHLRFEIEKILGVHYEG